MFVGVGVAAFGFADDGDIVFLFFVVLVVGGFGVWAVAATVVGGFEPWGGVGGDALAFEREGFEGFGGEGVGVVEVDDFGDDVFDLVVAELFQVSLVVHHLLEHEVEGLFDDL